MAAAVGRLVSHPGCVRANPRGHHRRRLAESWQVGNGTRQQAASGGGRTFRSLVTAPRRTLAASSRGCWCPKGRRVGKVPTERLRTAVRPARRASLHPSARREVVTCESGGVDDGKLGKLPPSERTERGAWDSPPIAHLAVLADGFLAVCAGPTAFGPFICSGNRQIHNSVCGRHVRPPRYVVLGGARFAAQSGQ